MWTDLVLAILALLPLLLAKPNSEFNRDAAVQEPARGEQPMMTALSLEAEPSIPLRQSHAA
jgi:hypothetical protein